MINFNISDINQITVYNPKSVGYLAYMDTWADLC